MSSVRDDIEKYLRGQMSPSEMHALEKRALNDPFLADALDGGSALPPDEFARDIKSLEDRINGKVSEKRAGVKWHYQAVAAVLLLGVSLFLIYTLTVKEQSVVPITMNTAKENKLQEESRPLADSATEAKQKLPDGDEPLHARDEPVSSESAEAPAAARTEQLTVEPPVASTDIIEQEIIAPESTAVSDSRAAGSDLRDTAEIQGFARAGAARRNVLQQEPAAAVKVPAENAVAEKSRTIRGKVTDVDDGLPLPGVNVVAKGSHAGTVTDLNGNYELDVPGQAESLVFSFIGL